jgi:hypothetical protein
MIEAQKVANTVVTYNNDLVCLPVSEVAQFFDWGVPTEATPGAVVWTCELDGI